MQTLKIAREIYREQDLLSTKKAFSELVEIDITEELEGWVCIFSNCQEPIEQTICEFENYLIDLSNQRK